MRIGDAAAAAGLTPRALRYYEERGLLTARRTSSGHRDYTAEDVRHLRAVRELLTAGLTIEDVRALVAAIGALPANRRDRPTRGEPRTDGSRADGSRADGEPGLCTLPNMIVRRRLAYLDERIERLTELRDGLAHRVGGPLRDLGRDLDPARTPAAG
ncbi:MerR family transcriptional regulator [Streptomyces bingchenggensis BCW-1]|uniref:MerR family transcriptional regulator n=1 Tax=Streptomyces bingchenggensis (strain BCW-1) TaxID=749414 RepID=D7BX84_STRBB|nr:MULTISPECIES: MerR family transcriptional regulator [Streptomyces]ADI07657.1 MerR family transcriptional regulator [Streptomyces bingchenggensis BCW-1]